jgi:cytochrome b561
MPDVHGGPPGVAMIWHISIGTVVLTLIAARLFWRSTHPVAPETALSPWRRITSEAVHWLLYVFLLLTVLVRLRSRLERVLVSSLRRCRC